MLKTSDNSPHPYPFIVPALILLSGLITAQLIGTLLVYLSNIALFQSLSLIKAHGYFIIPNKLVMDRLGQFTPAFIGGLFFTFTTGAGLCILTYGAVWSWLNIFNRNRIAGIVYMFLWACSLAAVNRKGFCPLVSLYFFIIPGLITIIMVKWHQRLYGPNKARTYWDVMVSVMLLTVLWATQMNSALFLNIRDSLLFSNTVGTAFNDIYYKYTLYPARVFKPLNQKMLKTYRLSGMNDKISEKAVEKILLERDYLRVNTTKSVDLNIIEKNNILFFYHGQKPLLNTTPKAFIAASDRILEAVSDKADPYGFFRQMTFFGLLVGFPLVLYVLLYLLFGFFLSLILRIKTASRASSILCFLIGSLIFLFFYTHQSTLVPKTEAATALVSDRWQVKVSALKTIIHYRMEIDPVQISPDILRDPHIAVRYWLAKSLSVGRKKQSYPAIMALINDPQPNVVCMALNALASHSDKHSIDIIFNKIETSDNWYMQWYGYKALRRLGWIQTASL